MSLENKVLAACAEVRGKALAALRALESVPPELARPRAEQAITALAATDHIARSVAEYCSRKRYAVLRRKVACRLTAEQLKERASFSSDCPASAAGELARLGAALDTPQPAAGTPTPQPGKATR
jgi:hypothetical protein